MARSRWAPGAAALADAARAVASILEGRSSDAALAPFDSVAQRSAVRAITLGTVRWYLRLAPAVETLLSRPQGVSAELRALLVATAHQIEYSRNAPQATVHAAVDAVRIIGEGRASGLVNAVLRRFVNERESLLARVDTELAGRTAHPRWFVRRLVAAWPQDAARILEGNNAHPPMTLRVDLTRSDRESYLDTLRAAGIAAQPVEWVPTAIRLDAPLAVTDLPGFAEGRVSVQDAGAQLAAPLLAAQPGMRVLDACAAPGGKTGHLLEHTPELAQLVAVDIEEPRVARIEENLRRLGREARLVVADVRAADQFWDGRPFDRILLDAPCSATGVIRRHPDIKLLRRTDDIAALADAQLEILRAAFALLAPGGRLLYSTCSVLPEENEGVVERFLALEPTGRVVPLQVELPPDAPLRRVGAQLLPGGQAGTDGFYYACLEKTTAGT